MVSRIPHRVSGARAAATGSGARAARPHRSRGLQIFFAGLCALGCERAAPGPSECVEFASAWLRARRPATQLEADTEFDALVRSCLTEPYDRELVTCVVGGQDQKRCRVDYVRRIEARREARGP